MTLPTHTHTLTLQTKEKEKITLDCKEINQMLKISVHKNVNKSKNHCSPVKLESKKQDKKIMDSREGTGGAIPSIFQEEPRPIY